MNKKVKFIIVLAILALFGYFVYSKFFVKVETPKVITTQLQKGDIRSIVSANGEVYARDLVDVGAQVSGQIKKLYVGVGDVVKKGDMIAEIDSVKQENEISRQRAQLLIHEANLAATEISAKNAKVKYNRELNLYNKKATSLEAVENAKNTAALQEANLKQIKAQIEQTKLALNTAETDLGYTKITAPIDGTIVSVPVEEGKTINANQSTPTIVKIADLTKMEIKMEVAEGDISKIKKGMKVEYTILSDLKNVKHSVISTIDPGLTTLSDGSYGNSNSASSSNSAKYFYVKVLVENDDDFLKIGMTTENSIITIEKENTSYLPTSALKRDKQGDFVYVLKGAKTEKIYVKTGASDDSNTEILEGLNDDDIIVLSGDIGGAKFASDGRGARSGTPPMRF
ncbi:MULTISPECIES: efflux RND transporter periplasmic adaptor subunit [unclassified Campylobacter]|uniref:efflux RND transporter periplasmic adaptor subunit n=1 Tax=unclassified Campylobacter TaxID=2593542 RepID=UPI0022E9F04F|nr:MULTISPECIES: efflux RND transporter periplasmic adaptor subunit [unclassified Campylobacter]MDA3080267.1 efflux RND transporter periplasmic adaptor subunit [Campylobacter sp. CS_NA2]MDA3081867.1 efflux RND transporter periplasmic adaptor subunit [Campylobacter sp. CS_NA1]MDA3086324.1 efflux RND transporter periplasmic adaptor subunit [Campylobacter sp. CS_ED1]MDA3089596.1 efflux RND transporter periplasmic adaptor subunit [Campylobacter sp. CS_ED2]WBR51832.1 efflux RND transporter periplas